MYIRRPYIIGYFFSALIGLLLDLFIFQSLIYMGFSPYHANIISSTLAITTCYICMAHFLQFKMNWTTFYIFFIYYNCSIMCFSFIIAYAAEIGHGPPLFYKFFSLPCSFIVNGFFCRYILGIKPI